MVRMLSGTVYSLIYAPLFREHLKFIDSKYYSIIRLEIEKQLSYEPNTETRNKKPLKRPAIFAAKWEIRLGPGNRFRVFYSINEENHQVHILALGEKKDNRLFVGGEEIDL